ncbi:hypothetical protein GCM10008090_31090 [Arenicella chitinivorans]|uniref:Yip1 domain-containing protein n=1 Tax=Arenicella chitinivorans TaxID=1329800 RepID=A0A918VSM1_9GAMM|nr:Yip1 family protein [Arenicella chitinivorans]GHA19097.1 hypothetical protein GCM10008090_31090 [Arenicella chitinivorans]
MSDDKQTQDPNENQEQVTPEAAPSTDTSPPFDINSVIADAKKIITDPVGFYRNMPQTGGFVDPILFVVCMGLVTAVIGFVLNIIGLAKFNTMMGGAIGFGMLIGLPIMFVIGSFIGAAILFVIWKLMGSQKNYEVAYRATAYTTALAPIASALSIIPYVAGIVKTLWSCFLLYTASVEVHELKAQTAKIVFGIFAALGVISNVGSEHTVRKYSSMAKKWSSEIKHEAREGSIAHSLSELENIEDMTPEEAGKQFGEFIKGMEKFSKGMEESIKEQEAAEKEND